MPEGPFPTPTPLPKANANLAAHAASGGVGLAITGAESSGEYKAENLKISWWVRNTGPFTTNSSFSVEVRFDGTVAANWTVNGLSTSTFVFAEEVEGLLSGIRPSAGVHEISLVIDPLNQVNETIESDNVISKQFTMITAAPDTTAPNLLPNLVPGADTGKVEPIFASSHPDDPLSGKLSVDQPTYVAFGVFNESIQYVTERVDVDLYIDDLLAKRVRWDGLAASSEAPARIDDLRSIVDITPGAHTLRLVVDPLDRVQESNESDNEYEVELVWGVGEPEAAAEIFVLEPPQREPNLLPNLVPYRKFGWDAAVTARQANSGLSVGKDGWLDSSEPTEIALTFTNAGRFDIPSAVRFSADVLLDGVQVETLLFNPGFTNSGSVWDSIVTLDAGTVSPGEHTVRVVLDVDGDTEELNEEDNIFERTFVFHDGPDPAPSEPFEMSPQELAAAFAPLYGEMMRQVKPVIGLGSGERDWTLEIIAAGRAGYFLLTGRDLNEEGYVIHFLPPDEFKAGAVSSCMNSWTTMTDEEYLNAFEVCTVGRGEIGFKTRSGGQIHLFVDLGLSPMNALGTYFHELGHGLQDLVSPEQTLLPQLPNTRGLYEAQAQIFEATAWRSIEEYTGNLLASFPDVVQAQDRFDSAIAVRADRNTEHDVGYRLLWTQALTDTNDLHLAEQLRTNGVLDAAGAQALYYFLVGLDPSEVEEWAADLLARPELIDEFKALAANRLIPDLAVELVGNPALQDTAWLAP